MFSIIVAIGLENEIGYDNKLLWHLRDDLKNFKQVTYGNKIIMGRKTFESLPNLLPNRKHIVLTKNKITSNYDNLEYYNNIELLINKYKDNEEEVFIIGGEQIYKQFEEYASKIYLTRVLERFDMADAFFDVDLRRYKCIDKTFYYKSENNEYDYTINTYVRN